MNFQTQPLKPEFIKQHGAEHVAEQIRALINTSLIKHAPALVFTDAEAFFFNPNDEFPLPAVEGVVEEYRAVGWVVRQINAGQYAFSLPKDSA